MPAPLCLRPRWCGPDKNCTAPLLSIIKTADGAAGSDTDILIPQFLFLAKSTYHYPWHLKKDIGERLISKVARDRNSSYGHIATWAILVECDECNLRFGALWKAC